MVARKRIGLIFVPNKRWMGGVYYILNLINALNSLSDERKPEIVLLCKTREDYILAKEYTNYPYLDFRLAFHSHNNFARRIINKIGRLLKGENIVAFRKINERFDAIYPITYRFQIQSQSPLLYWVPDFQEKHLPEFFSEEERLARDKNNNDIVATGRPVVVSSYDALTDLHKCFPLSNKSYTPVFHFASSIPRYDESRKESILSKFNIAGPFLLCANQFWVHKNHMVLFKAVEALKRQGKEITVLCSGNLYDHRNPQYGATLIDFVKSKGLTENIKFLGLIEREELVCLMNESIALVQPSLFEGWNTSIEEAKALNKYLIVSDIPLHREQVERNVSFFDPHSSEDLADKLWEVWVNKPEIDWIDYTENLQVAGETFMEIIDRIQNV